MRTKQFTSWLLGTLTVMFVGSCKPQELAEINESSRKVQKEKEQESQSLNFSRKDPSLRRFVQRKPPLIKRVAAKGAVKANS